MPEHVSLQLSLTHVLHHPVRAVFGLNQHGLFAPLLALRFSFQELFGVQLTVSLLTPDLMQQLIWLSLLLLLQLISALNSVFR